MFIVVLLCCSYLVNILKQTMIDPLVCRGRADIGSTLYAGWVLYSLVTQSSYLDRELVAIVLWLSALCVSSSGCREWLWHFLVIISNFSIYFVWHKENFLSITKKDNMCGVAKSRGTVRMLFWVFVNSVTVRYMYLHVSCEIVHFWLAVENDTSFLAHRIVVTNAFTHLRDPQPFPWKG